MSKKDKTSDDLQNIQTILMMIRNNFEKLEERIASLETLMKMIYQSTFRKKYLTKIKNFDIVLIRPYAWAFER